MVQINGRFSLDRLVLKSHQSERLIRSSSEEQLLQTAILGERLGNHTFQNGRSSRRKRTIGVGVATLVGALAYLGYTLLRG